jgi:polysaccharide export outer membrane protein
MAVLKTRVICVILAAVFIVSQIVWAQEGKEEIKREAETKLEQMTPQQVDAKIKEMGMTRQEAEGRAKELGIDLDTYLKGDSPTTHRPVVTPPPLKVSPQTVESERKDVERGERPRPSLIGPGGLPYFGYDVFSIVPSAFEPTAVGPVDPEYLIGPDDVLRVTVWGQVEFQNELVVDREGRIFIPTIGQVLVSGLTLEKAYESLKKQMSRSYSGLVSQPPTVWFDITLARLRPKRVFIMGEVASPGGYTVSSYSTVFNALFSVGGPTVRGSLREVRVIRGNKTVARVDLYDYLTGADKTNDIRIQNNDIIYVPPRGTTVSVSGEVRIPAIYELKTQENLSRLLDFAGGALSTAYLERVQVDRILPFDQRKRGELERRIVDVNFREILNQKKDYTLVDGDRVTIYSVFEERKNVVTISGSVARPGQYQLDKAPTVRALIAAADGLLPKTYLGIAHLVRYNEDLITQRVITIDLEKIMKDTTTDVVLESLDGVFVHSTEAIEIKSRFVTIRGEVQRPGRYPLGDDMTLGDLVLLAGGYTEAAEHLKAEVSRVPQRGLPGDSLALILRPNLPQDFSWHMKQKSHESDRKREEHFFLEHRDEVMIFANPDYILQQNVMIEGEVQYPGVYSIKRRGERLSEIIDRAGGPTTTSYMGGAQYFRGGKRLLIDLKKAYTEKDPIHDVVLLAGDRVVVPSKPHTVLVSGEVNKPGLVSFVAGDDVSGYIDRAGGLTDSARYAILELPTGESRRVNFGWFRADPTVLDGSTITVVKVQAEPPEAQKTDVAATIKDIFAIATSAATIAFIVFQVTK